MSDTDDPQKKEAAESGCPLPTSSQTRNLGIFAACFWLQYLAAPVTYVGKNQAALCSGLGADDVVSNLPATIYFATSFLPLVVAWYFPYVSYLRRNIIGCYTANAVAMAAVAVGLVSPIPDAVKITLVVVQCAAAGVAMPAAAAFLWEAIGRGVAESRRGFTLGLTFGAGPILAVLGSLLSQGILPPDPAKRFSFVPDFPGNFALLYAVCAPLTLLCALAGSRLFVPLPERELPREPFLQGVFGGVGNYLSNRVLLFALVVITLVYTGNLADANMGLYTQQALGADPAAFAGWQNVMRFGGKALAGLGLGWLLARTTPRAGLLATASFYLGAQLWAIGTTGLWYLPAFALYGAGELIGVYGPNYVLCASSRAHVRRNMALVSCFNSLASPAGVLFGAISDVYDKTATGYRLSFAVCAGFIGLGIVLALVALPARPRPESAS
jgi:Sec-independent protein secretion pathway component TatC